MPSDPTTKDPIQVARDDAVSSHTVNRILRQHIDALADRLEEVEQERDVWKNRFLGRMKWLEDRMVADMEKNFPKPSDPEPEDDPWDAIERLHGKPAMGWLEESVIGALLDLRKSMGTTGKVLHRILDREWKILDGLDKHDDRITTLEGHADRGHEAERELRGRVGRLEDKDRHALRARGTLRDDLEKLDDWTEALAERVERLEDGTPERAQ